MSFTYFGASKLASFVISTVLSTGIQSAKLEHNASQALKEEQAKVQALGKLHGTNENLQKVVLRAKELAKERGLEFRVREGLRTLETQKSYLKRGVTQTLTSNHLTGDAVDLVPVVNGEETHDWKHFYPMADLMMEAAKELGVTIRWGGAWHRTLNESGNLTAKELSDQYVSIRRMQNRTPFMDGFHFEIYDKKQ